MALSKSTATHTDAAVKSPRPLWSDDWAHIATRSRLGGWWDQLTALLWSNPLGGCILIRG